MKASGFAILILLFLFCIPGLAQLPLEPGAAVREANERMKQMATDERARSIGGRQDYAIGPEDLIEIQVFEVPDLSRTVRVSAGGEISLPLVGTVRVAGLSPLELERVLTELLRRTYIKEPQVTVFLKEFKADPVSVIGAVKLPGLYHIQTRKTLVEVLAMAQGLSDGPLRHPGKSIVITRKARTAPARTPVQTSEALADSAVGRGASADTGNGPAGSADGTAGGASPDTAGEIIEIPLKELFHTGNPRYNVPIYPGDVVKVVPAGTVYVAGSVNKPGSFPLTDFDNISAIQALAMAGGTTKAASQKKALIIRTELGGARVEEKVDLSRILKGKDADTVLGPNDILFVPGSVGKESAIRAIEMGIQTLTGMLIWRR